MFIIYYLAVD